MDSMGVRFRWRKRTAMLFFRTMDRINDYTRYFILAPAFPRYLPLRDQFRLPKYTLQGLICPPPKSSRAAFTCEAPKAAGGGISGTKIIHAQDQRPRPVQIIPCPC